MADRVKLTARQVSAVTRRAQKGESVKAIVEATGLKQHIVKSIVMAAGLTKARPDWVARAESMVAFWQGKVDKALPDPARAARKAKPKKAASRKKAASKKR